MGVTKKYTFIYKTTNLINGKFYIGYHTTNDLADGYIGCGILSQAHAEGSKRYGLKSALIDAVCKYGYFNFSSEILEYFDTVEEAIKREEEIVDLDFVRRKDTYNLVVGGKGGGKPSWLHDHYEDVVSMFANGKTLKEISEYYNIGFAAIRKVLRSKGLVIQRKTIPQIYKKYGHLVDEIQSLYATGKHSIESIKRKYKIDYKTIKKFLDGIKPKVEVYIAISPHKEIIKITNFKEFCKKYNLFRSGIKPVLDGKSRHYKGWLFFREEDWDGRVDIAPKLKNNTSSRTGTKLVSPSGDIFEVTGTLVDFCKNHSLCYVLILKVLRNAAPHHKGWTKFKVNEEDSQVLSQ